MHGRLIAPAVVALATLAVAASPAAAKQVKLTIADTGGTVTVSEGDTVRIALAANQTTPFHWVVTDRPARSVARVTRAQYVSDPGNGMPGAGGTQVYVIKAVATGRTAFATQYQELSSGEPGRGRSDFTIKIRVR